MLRRLAFLVALVTGAVACTGTPVGSQGTVSPVSTPTAAASVRFTPVPTSPPLPTAATGSVVASVIDAKSGQSIKGVTVVLVQFRPTLCAEYERHEGLGAVFGPKTDDSGRVSVRLEPAVYLAVVQAERNPYQEQWFKNSAQCSGATKIEVTAGSLLSIEFAVSK